MMLEKKLPLGIVLFMWSLLCCKTLVFCVGDAECKTLTGYKGLRQGSVLSPFLYNLLGSGIDRFVPPGCDFLQYADDIVVYSTHHLFQTACALVQTAFASWTHGIFYNVGGDIALAASGLDPDWWQIVATSGEFQVFGGIF
jgi:hypothetical protein